MSCLGSKDVIDKDPMFFNKETISKATCPSLLCQSSKEALVLLVRKTGRNAQVPCSNM